MPKYVSKIRPMSTISGGYIGDMPIQQMLDLGRGTHWDRTTIGLGIRINKNRPGVFIGKYRKGGQQYLVTLGTVDELSYAEAKQKLQALRADGQPARSSLTFAEFAVIYIRDYSSVYKKTYGEDQRRINRYLLPAFGHLRLTDIDADAVRALHVRISRTAPRQADHVGELLRAMLNKAKKWGKLPRDHYLPTNSIDWHAKVERDRFVTKEEMPRLAACIAKLPRLQQRAMLLMYLLTGCRKMELVNLRWEEVDLDRNVIRLSAARNKSGKIIYKPLSKYARAVIDTLPNDEPFVFAGRYKGSRLYCISDLWRQVRVEAGLEDVVLHDLRRTIGSWLAQSGQSLHLIAQILGQTTTHVTRVYSRFQQQHLTDALDHHATDLESFFQGILDRP